MADGRIISRDRQNNNLQFVARNKIENRFAFGLPKS
jgi:hypothetical protein